MIINKMASGSTLSIFVLVSVPVYRVERVNLVDKQVPKKPENSEQFYWILVHTETVPMHYVENARMPSLLSANYKIIEKQALIRCC